MESIANNLPNNASLEYLHIESCAELKSLPVGLHKLCHLNKIEIWSCPSFVSFPDGGLFPTSLRELSIHGCEKLEAWPNCMPNLNSLHIVNCPSVIYFPEEGYPTSLTSLSFGGENIYWQSFPDEQDGKLTMTLPSSLTQLSIWSIPNIVILSSLGFQNLSALEQLYIRYCPKLASLPEKGLPPSLLQLYINECPLLKQHCKKGGREWSKIANVPCVEIDRGLSMSWRRSSNKKIVKQRAIFTHNSYSFLPVLQQRLASELLNVLLEFQNMEVISKCAENGRMPF
ncbi:hypothetical protein CMV_007632 [Castanea mollissima]|uniref:Disease resistance protein n=1 Tax=Castanea mollissima TaxID=60419 RepID=A0A8J4RNU7_9ROSI|nr:hypothetical protein CMV_007632 [Castanea mollissima]